VDKIRIAKKLRPVGKGMLHRLGDEMQIVGRALLHLRKIPAFKNVEHREERHPPELGGGMVTTVRPV